MPVILLTVLLDTGLFQAVHYYVLIAIAAEITAVLKLAR